MTDANASPAPTDDRWQSVAADLGILGFGPHCDAIQQPLHDGIRIWYYRDGRVRWVQRAETPRREWTSAADTDLEDAKRTLSAADELTVIDKRLFNAVSSWIDHSGETVHDGIVWGAVRQFGPQLRAGETPFPHSYTAVPGVGDRTASKLGRALSQFPGTMEGREV